MAANLPSLNTAGGEVGERLRTGDKEYQWVVCMLHPAGKRKGLLWKEVDGGTAEMLPHTTSVLNVMRLVQYLPRKTIYICRLILDWWIE